MKENNSYNKFMVSNEYKMKDVETGVSCSINLETTEAVTKILAISACGECSQAETLANESNVNGNVFIKLIYITEGGLIGNAEYSAPFVAKFVDNNITLNTKLCPKIITTTTNVESLTGNIAKVNCAIKLGAMCVNNEEIKYLSACGDDVCVKEEENKYETFSGMINSSWTESLEASVKDQIKKVLSSCSSVYVKDVKADDGFIVIDYEITNNILYLTDGESNEIKTVNTKDSFKQEIECEYATKNSKAEAKLTVKADKAKTNLEYKEDCTSITVEVVIDACVFVYTTSSVNVISDLYSVSNMTNTTSLSYTNSFLCDSICFDKKVEGSVKLDENEPRIDKLLAVNYSNATPLSEYIEKGKYTVSGIITSNLIYFNQDDNMVYSVDVEIPFEVSEQTDYDGEYTTDLALNLDDVDVMVKHGTDVYVDAVLKIKTKVCGLTRGAVISELEYGEEVAEKDCGIEIYFAHEGEKVWDIAKKLYIYPEVLYSQNPELGEELTKDSMLSLYYKKKN